VYVRGMVSIDELGDLELDRDRMEDSGEAGRLKPKEGRLKPKVDELTRSLEGGLRLLELLEKDLKEVLMDVPE
jgi:hypothetical protein